MIFENSCNIHYTWPKVHKVYNNRRQLIFQTIYFLSSGLLTYLSTRKVHERVLDYLCFYLKRRAIKSPSVKSGVAFGCTILLAVS